MCVHVTISLIVDIWRRKDSESKWINSGNLIKSTPSNSNVLAQSAIVSDFNNDGLADIYVSMSTDGGKTTTHKVLLSTRNSTDRIVTEFPQQQLSVEPMLISTASDDGVQSVLLYQHNEKTLMYGANQPIDTIFDGIE